MNDSPKRADRPIYDPSTPGGEKPAVASGRGAGAAPSSSADGASPRPVFDPTLRPMSIHEQRLEDDIAELINIHRYDPAIEDRSLARVIWQLTRR